jgi:hypothetical protein
MHEQLEFDLNPIEKSKVIPEIYKWFQEIIDDTSPLVDSIILGDFLICPNCDAKYIEESWCECWYWVQVEEKIDLDELDFLEVADKKKAKYIKLWTIKFNTSSNIKAKNFYIPENREFVVDINNSIIGTNEAILYVKIKNFKCKIVCNYETINQLDENHRIDEELWKVTHNVRIIKVIELKWDQEIEFDFKQDILKQLKFLITIEILNNYKYNKNL